MSVVDYDVVIVGGGVSALMAGIHLVEQGRAVALISRGDPACCLATGCIDLLALGDNPLAAMDDLPPEHPYHLVSREMVRAALAKFRQIMVDAKLPYTGAPEQNRAILTPLGATKTTCLVPCTMEAAPRQAEEYIHVVSFKGLKDFYPSYITSSRKNTGFSVFDAGVSTTMALATRFDDRDFVAGFIDWLKDLEIPGGTIALPAVLGLESPLSIFSEALARLDRWLFEIPTLPPSIPGIRLFRALKRDFQRKGGNVYWGQPVASVERTGQHVEALTIETPGRPTRVHGQAFILATGSFVSGGLYAGRDAVTEDVFGLPVHVPGPRATWFNRNFFTPGHGIERAGIKVDTNFQPVDSSLENLFVCGSILAFCDIMKYGCGHGLALSTGLAAAQACGRYLA